MYNLNESKLEHLYTAHTPEADRDTTVPHARHAHRHSPSTPRTHRSPPDPPRVVITVAYYTQGPYGAGPIGYETRSRSCAPQNGRK